MNLIKIIATYINEWGQSKQSVCYTRDITSESDFIPPLKIPLYQLRVEYINIKPKKQWMKYWSN